MVTTPRFFHRAFSRHPNGKLCIRIGAELPFGKMTATVTMHFHCRVDVVHDRRLLIETKHSFHGAVALAGVSILQITLDP